MHCVATTALQNHVRDDRQKFARQYGSFFVNIKMC